MGETFDDSGAPRRDLSTFVGTHLVRIIECDRPLAGGSRYVLDGVDRVTVGRGDAVRAHRSAEGGVVTLDVRVPARSMSSVHARFLRVGSDWAVEDLGSKNGTLVNGVRVTRAVLEDGAVVELGHTLFGVRRTLMETGDANVDVEVSPREPDGGGTEIVTLDPTFARRLESLGRVATSDVNVLVTGESGTGKELVARWIHERRSRGAGAFVAVNCGAIPASLVESQLFGHVKGAFSGAIRDEEGFVRAASGGTLFLDEIADLPGPVQASLLRVIQEREVVPVGSTRPVKVDFRLVSATHRSLTDMVADGAFRRDLYARVAGFELVVPPLRERKDDTGILVAVLLQRTLGERAASLALTQDVGRALLAYDWPYNVRELEQCLKTSAALAGGGLVERSHLPGAVSAALEPRDDAAAPAADARPADVKLRLDLLDQLTRHGGNLADVARSMGKARMQIHRWCKRFGIDPNVFRR
jgi:transcriptional regulator with GAF, ATPase, and Fis domain